MSTGPPPGDDPKVYDTAPDNLEADNGFSAIDRNLSRAMSHAENMDELEQLSRHLSSRRQSIVNPDGTLAFDPDNLELTTLLKTLAYRLDQEGLTQARTGVTFKALTSLGVDAGSAYQPSISEIWHSIANLPSAIKAARNPPIRKIIRNVTGFCKSGEMLLVLGRPGSGCTTLLKTIAGEIDQLKGVEGTVLYDGVPLDQMIKTFKREILYNPERK